MQYLWHYLFLINAAACLLMLWDKRKAQRKQWRIPETLLLGFAYCGGSLGAALGMVLFHHKTRHPKFSIGVPLALLVHMGILLLMRT